MTSLWRRLFGFGRKTAASNAPALVTAPPIVETPTPAQGNALLLLGIDFGTAFTKVVWRQWGGTRVGVAPIGDGGQSMAPSMVWVDGHGGLHLTDPGGGRSERLLKMRLASGDPNDGDPEEIAALCVFFVGSALRMGLSAARKAFRGAEVSLYGAALGCPAAFCDDGRVETFQRVAARAWRWAHDPQAPRALPTLKAWIRANPGADANVLFEARAEVAAAVDCFIMRADAEEGRYVFLDVGAGTLDGACFKLYRVGNAKKVTVLSTSVAPLGVEMVSRTLANTAGGEAASWAIRLFEPGGEADPAFGGVRSEVGGFIGALMTRARSRDPIADWLAARDARPRVWTSLEDRVDLARHLPVFFGGGGMISQFYREAARKAGASLSNNYGIPRLALGSLAEPPGFEGVKDADFHRFAVAFGLTRPFTDTPAWILPTQLATSSVLTASPVSDRLGVDYGSSKDAYQ